MGVEEGECAEVGGVGGEEIEVWSVNVIGDKESTMGLFLAVYFGLYLRLKWEWVWKCLNLAN